MGGKHHKHSSKTMGKGFRERVNKKDRLFRIQWDLEAQRLIKLLTHVRPSNEEYCMGI